jgi:hypothetical protein
MGPVELLEAGSAPRRALRLALAPGVRQALTFRAETSVVTPGGVRSLPAMSVAILATQSAGKNPTDTDVTFRFDDFKLSAPEGAVPPGALARAQAILERVKMIEGRYVVTDRGVPNGSRLNLDGAAPEMRAVAQPVADMLDTATVAFPAEPVGLGARWRQRVPRRVQGIELVDVTTYELVEDTGQTLTIRKTGVQSADPQPMPLPDGRTGKLVKYAGNTSGSVKLNLTRSQPENLEMTASSSLAAQEPGAAQPVAVEMIIKASMGAVDAH